MQKGAEWVGIKGVGLDKIGNVHGHLVNLCIVELLNVFEHTFIISCYKVNGHALSTKPASSTDPRGRGRGERGGRETKC